MGAAKENIDNMISFASNNYECKVSYKFSPETVALESDAAVLACGLGGVGSFAANLTGISQITGDPEADGFFKIGFANESGGYIRTTGEPSYIPGFEVYVTSFIWNDGIVEENGSERDSEPAFADGDMVIGFGYKVIQDGTVDRGNTLVKVDPFALIESFRPSTILEPKPQANGVGSGFGGDCTVGRFFLNIGPDNAKSGKWYYISQCNPGDSENFDYTTDIDLKTEAKKLLPGNFYYNQDSPKTFEMLLNANQIFTSNFQNTPSVQFEQGWKFVLSGAIRNPNPTPGVSTFQSDGSGFGLPLACAT